MQPHVSSQARYEGRGSWIACVTGRIAIARVRVLTAAMLEASAEGAINQASPTHSPHGFAPPFPKLYSR